MKTWKKSVLWGCGIAAVALATGVAYWAGFRRGQVQGESARVNVDLSLNIGHYSTLKALETEELAQNDDWRHVLSNLKMVVFGDVAFVERHPDCFEFEGRHKDRFECKLQTARDLIADIELVPLRQVVEECMGTTNLTEKVGRNSISYTRTDMEE